MTVSQEDLIVNTFYITYVFLITTGTITFIESLRTKEEKVRNILNLETCISVIAAFFYGKFVKELDTTIDYKKINETRYVDWAITTPIMLLVLILAFLFNNKEGAFSFSKYLVILVLNYAMLGFGYVGEIGLMDRITSNGLGFIAFAGIYYYFFQNYIKGRSNNDDFLLYSLFLFLWALYGVFYFFDSISRNVGYNVLDLFSRCFVGIFFWAYYTKVFKPP